MDLVLKQRLLAAGALAVALFAGWQIAQGSLGLVLAMMALGLLILATFLLRVDPDALVAGAVIVGYLVGNRGFAQLHPPNLPLLPGELALGLGLACGAWRWARSHTVPIRRDSLNAALLVWIAISAVQLPLNFMEFGLLAVRDFAMVYYATFFFLGQAWAESDSSRRWLTGSLSVGLALTVPVFAAFLRWPEFFTSRLLVAGNPLIFVKSDVAGSFMAGGAFWFAERFTRTRRPGWFALCGLGVVGVAASNSRAAVVALAGGLLWLVVLRAWRIAGTITACFAVGLAGLAIHAAITKQPFTQTPFYRIYESAASITDLQNNRTYLAADLGDKPDNNQFRLIWWRTVVEETWADGRFFGLGFGADLAADFLRVYYADTAEDFSARSPHNFMLSVFGRTGLVGFATLLVVLFAMIARTRLAGRESLQANQPDSALAPWLLVWAIFTAACFGVVLEGPMGAIVFWITLGMANAWTQRTASTTAIEEAAEPVAALPAGAR